VVAQVASAALAEVVAQVASAASSSSNYEAFG
jgi:hypothetical protein